MLKKKLQKSFIKLLSIFVILILLSGVLLFYSTMQFIFLNHVNQANINMIEQISSSFELVLEQIIDKANKLGIYDNKLVQLLDGRKSTVLDEIELYTTLNSIILENQYLHSAYLYSEEEDLILDSKSGCSYPTTEFFDPYVVEPMKEKYFTKVNPHPIRNGNGNTDLLYSIIVLLPVHTKNGSGAVLSLNVDMNKLYKDIMKRNSFSNEVALFIYDQNNQIIVSKFAGDLAKDMSEIEKNITIEVADTSIWYAFSYKSGIMAATGYSKALNWSFSLQVPFIIDISNMIDKYVTLIFISAIAVLFFIIIYIILRHTTKPLDIFLHNYNEKILKDLLNESNYINENNYIEMDSLKRLFPHTDYVILLIDVEGTQGELIKVLSAAIEELSVSSEHLFLKALPFQKDRVAVICNFSFSLQSSLIEQEIVIPLYQKLTDLYMKQVYISISTYKQEYLELWIATKECEEILEYKLSLPEHIMHYRQFSELKGEIPYPIQYEKQLVNNLLVANTENCMHYLDKFMDHLFNNQYIISDSIMKNYFYQLQIELLKRISSLPISVKTTGSLNLNHITDKDCIYDNYTILIHTICTEITKKDNKNESILFQSILDYIQNNLTENNFNLNTISYQFNLNRNYLAKLIKENTNYSFNDYVNYKKIEMSKELLKNPLLTIEQISNQVGFHYSHYFIKVFKVIEGITPGAYRKTLHNNNIASIT